MDAMDYGLGDGRSRWDEWEESTDVESGLIYRTTSSMPNDEESDRS